MREGKRTQRMMPALLDFWFDFASTYSDPAAMRVAPLARQSGVMVRFRPFLLGPLFKAQGWPTSPFNLYPAKGRYMWRDLERICFDLDLPFRQPDPFPQNSLLAARVALVGLSSSWGEEFCRGVFRAEFGDSRQIDDPTIIGDILSRLHIEAALAGSGSEGVVVTDVDPNGLASEHGFKTGDVILDVGGKKVANPLDVRNAIADAHKEGKRTILMRLKSDDATKFVAIPIDRA